MSHDLISIQAFMNLVRGDFGLWLGRSLLIYRNIQ